jgi:hypothetical protein
MNYQNSKADFCAPQRWSFELDQKQTGGKGMKLRKVVSVVGAGNVGEHTAALLALRGLVDVRMFDLPKKDGDRLIEPVKGKAQEHIHPLGYSQQNKGIRQGRHSDSGNQPSGPDDLRGL